MLEIAAKNARANSPKLSLGGDLLIIFIDADKE